MELKKREIKDAVILSPKQAYLLVRFLELSEVKLVEDKALFPEFDQDINSDLNTVRVMKEKVAEFAAGTPRAVSMFEGIILASLLMTFPLNHYDIDNIAPDIEEIGRLFHDRFHEAGYPPVFYIVMENKLS